MVHDDQMIVIPSDGRYGRFLKRTHTRFDRLGMSGIAYISQVENAITRVALKEIKSSGNLGGFPVAVRHHPDLPCFFNSLKVRN